MSKLGLFLLLALPTTVFGQRIITIDPQQCLWHAGDDPAWAATNIDESGWQPYTQWKLNPDQPRIWVRCHANLSALRGMAHPAIQMSLYAAYQFYLNGTLIGGAGNLRSGFFSMNTIQSYSASAFRLTLQPVTLGVRIAYRFSGSTLDLVSPLAPPAQPLIVKIRASDSTVLNGLRANEVMAQLPVPFLSFICFVIIGVLGLVLFGQFQQDRGRRDLLLLSLTSLSMTAVYVQFFCAGALLNSPVWANIGAFAAAVVVLIFTQTLYFFSQARRRVPLLFWAVMGLASSRHALLGVGLFLSLSHALRFDASLYQLVSLVSDFARIACLAAPLVAFWPYRSITRRMVPLATLCMAWGVSTALLFATNLGVGWAQLLGLQPGIPRWHATTGLQAFITAGVVITLLGLLSRDQQRTAQERAELAGEMDAARNVQQYLISRLLPETPGLAIQSEYRPSREVGGDFFQVLPQSADSSVLIVVGDVAGKGIEAGMLAALIVGAIRTAAVFTSDPERILALLNERLQGRGLVTCLALRIERDGIATIVNAGHLPPFLNGRELIVDGALPLGAVPGMDFSVSRLKLAENDTLMLMTDGVAEAQNGHGQLFGFERIGELLAKGVSGTALVEAAQNFGQQDDITVLTVKFVPVRSLA